MASQKIDPRIRGFICTTSHPEGCAANVRQQIAVAKAGGPGKGLGTVVVIGSSAGYGLSSLITAIFGYGADAIGVCFERPSQDAKVGSAGWYNTCAVQQAAREAGRKLTTFNVDAFSHDAKKQVVDELKRRGVSADLVVYSLASPKRKDPDSDALWSSVLKPLATPYSGKTVDLDKEVITLASIEPAKAEEITQTIKVMGGEDWALWVRALKREGLLSKGCRTVAYSYIGPELTHAIYRSGTIGCAKEDLERTARALDADLQQSLGGNAWVSVNKALVTQASSAIPVVPLYISLLYKIMRERKTHEGTIEQMVRLFATHLAPGKNPKLDDKQRIRMDDWEMDKGVQAEVARLWPDISSENLFAMTDYAGFKRGFRQLFGFEVEGVDYEQPVEVHRQLG